MSKHMYSIIGGDEVPHNRSFCQVLQLLLAYKRGNFRMPKCSLPASYPGTKSSLIFLLKNLTRAT